MDTLAGEPKKRILVVDDDEQVCRLFRQVLVVAGCEVETANSAADATRLLFTGHFDLVTLDVSMPQTSGAQVHRIWSQELGNGRSVTGVVPRSLPPILLITGFKEDAFAIGLAFGERVVGVIEKPVDAHTLMRTVSEVLSYEETRGAARRQSARVRGPVPVGQSFSPAEKEGGIPGAGIGR